MSLTLLQKIWNLHTVVSPSDDDETLLYVDRNFVHEESSWAFDSLKRERRAIAHQGSNITFADHYAPTVQRDAGVQGIADVEVRSMLTTLAANAKQHALRHFDIDHPQQGIMHVVAPELGMTLPGMVVTGSDSHTCTNGALGALAFGVGQSELKQVFMTQTVWRRRPKPMRVMIDGSMGPGVTAKDIILQIISVVGANGGSGYVVEYGGSCVARMTMEQRMTLCNMAIEMGSQSGIVAPDDMTFGYLAERQYAPKGTRLADAVEFWKTLPSDASASYARELRVDAGAVAPMVTWGTMLEDVGSVDGCVPDPSNFADPARRARVEKALKYMGLEPKMALNGIPIDVVFIGSCTNSRIEDLRVAAAIAKGRRAVVRTVVSPGSSSIKRQAESEGLDQIFKDAGFEWRDSGCSMCVGSNGDIVARGDRCASTSPRNFEGRQGVGARTHVMSPTMAVGAAVTGRITDIRSLLG